MFAIEQQITTYARTGVMRFRGFEVRTPLFMPVGTRGAVKSVSPEQVASTGAQIILGNTYHLHLKPGERVVEQLGGLHEFMNWKKGPILTDSGGFQVFSLSHIRKITEEGVEFVDPATGDKIFISPEISMQIQVALGSDIIMAFDDLTGLSEHERHREKEAVERTHRWLERSVAEFTKITKDMDTPPLLFGIVQGGLDKELRKQSLEFVQSQSVSGIAIGGLSVGEPIPEMYAMLEFLAPLYDPSRPHYLMGVGEPADLRKGIEHGIDMFDCVLPTRNARHGSVWIRGDKKLNLKNAGFELDRGVIDEGCDCYTCQQGFSRGFLRHQLKVGEPLAGTLLSVHNLRYLQRVTEEYRTK